MNLFRDLKVKEKHVFLVIFITSFLISLSFVWGKIDPDFFSFYYVGKGVAQGKDMYIDFADNKGPVLYYFFSLLYLLFKNNYKLALIFTSTVLDTLLSFFSISLAMTWLKAKKTMLTRGGIFVSVFVTLLIKSFSIGTFTGGVYSETVAFLFILLSFLLIEKKRNFLAGILFSLAILTRPTAVFWVFVPFVQLIVRKEKISYFLNFLAGVVTSCLILIFLYLISGGSMMYLLDNLIIFNYGYSRLVKVDYFKQLVLNLFFEPRLFLSFCLVLIFSYLSLVDRKVGKSKYLIFVVFVSSILSTFVSGLFYFHYFVQFGLIVALTLVFLHIRRKIYLFSPVLLLLFVFVVINFYSFIFLKDSELDLRPVQNFLSDNENLLNEKRYLMVITYYPQLYFMYNKIAPDRYFQPYFLSQRFNVKVDKDVERHSKLNRNILDDTLFLIVSKNRFDEWYKKEYLAKFAKGFGLTRVADVSDEKEEMSLFTTHTK